MHLSIRGVLVAGAVALLVVTATAIGVSSYLSSERALERMARDLTANAAGWTIEQIENLLGPATEARQLSQRLADARVLNVADADALEEAFFGALGLYPALSAISYGASDGDLIYVGRNESLSPGGFLTKIITVDGDDREVTLVWRDRERRLILREVDVDDPYDPRLRPWYQRAMIERRTVWTNPYVFYTVREPGITAATPVLGDRGALMGVVGVDLRIDDLSRSLAARRISQNGFALVLNQTGEVIAYPDQKQLLVVDDDPVNPFRLAKLNDLRGPLGSAFVESLNLDPEAVKIDRPTFNKFEVDNTRYLGLLAPFPSPQWPWYIAVVLPEQDYLGGILDNQRNNLAITLLLAVFAVLAALILGRGIVRPLRQLRAQAAVIDFDRAEGMPPPVRTPFAEIAETAQVFSRTRDEMRYQEERYVLASRGANDGLFDSDLASGETYFSPRMNEIVGLPENGLGDRLEAWSTLVHPEDQVVFSDAISAFLGTGGGAFDLEYRVRHVSGAYRWVRTRATAVRDIQGRAVRAAGSTADITGQREAEAKLLHDARNDSLTGLPNRVLFMDRLEEALLEVKSGKRQGYAVLYLDLDRFKQVNDSLGQGAGDDMLVAIAGRIEAAIGRGLVARIGSDQFAVMTRDAPDRDAAVTLGERVRDNVGRSMMLAGQEVFPLACVGIALCTPGYVRAEDVLADAALAMSRAKMRGRGSVTLFDRAMRSRATVGALALETDLRHALDREEIVLHYQPVISITTGAVVGFEALMRWQHTDKGSVPPDVFIPLAEETGLIVPLGAWALGEACRQVAAWRGADEAGGRLFMSVNVSRRQLEAPDLVEHIRTALADSGIPAGALRLEITESLLLGRPDHAAGTLAGIKDLGARLSIDDFGTGYSSLSHLHRLPFDILKIDKSFVADIMTNPGSAVIVRAIVDLASSLGMDVVAEGAENAGDIEALRKAGVEYCQGYYYCRPLPPEEAERYLMERAVLAGLSPVIRRAARRSRGGAAE
ncbi:MAG TPA: EAL domain-containing protein [Alphaproteobacteria bacterium]|nr:EAL domain-containing protein [Alphaproteobacteria bacterium]